MSWHLISQYQHQIHEIKSPIDVIKSEHIKESKPKINIEEYICEVKVEEEEFVCDPNKEEETDNILDSSMIDKDICNSLAMESKGLEEFQGLQVEEIFADNLPTNPSSLDSLPVKFVNPVVV
mgnify:CR=1 FL=1